MNPKAPVRTLAYYIGISELERLGIPDRPVPEHDPWLFISRIYQAYELPGKTAAEPGAGREMTIEPEFITAAEIATKTGKTEAAVRAKLTRLKKRFPDCCERSEMPRHGEAKFLYRTQEIMKHFTVE